MLAPLGVAVAGGAAFLGMLHGMEAGRFDPRGVPSPLIGRRIPDFSLPAQAPGDAGFGSADILAQRRPLLVNFFASWCVPCELEQPVLMALQARKIPIWGIAYKDKADAAAKMLAEKGNPYTRLARDEPGRVAIDWGVYGVPETYFVDAGGIIRWKWAGPLTDGVVSAQLDQLLRKYA
jgi:cytochrome c biogenesis protein CcmG/thiol:disulfide interchange protein DsbE